jgi:tetratricopeptide (TPR) repeat protein
MRGRSRSSISRATALLAALLAAPVAGCGPGESKSAASADTASAPAPADLTALLRRDHGARPLAQAEVFTWLSSHEFAELERQIDAVQASFEAGAAEERFAVNAFAAFRSPDASLLEHLDAWVAARPASYASRAARGLFLAESGWRARGTPGSSDVPAQAVPKLHRAALEDLRAAVAARPGLMLGYGEIIRIAAAAGDRTLAAGALESALQAYPQSYWVRSAYMELLRPRHGGSHEQMAGFARDAQQQLRKNPRLVLLGAGEFTDRGETALLAKDCESAIRSYTEALGYGPDLDALRGRGRCLAELERDGLALRDFDAVLLIEPDSAEVLVRRGRIYRKLERIEKAALDFKQAEAQEPIDSWVLGEIGLNHQQLGRLEQAVRSYERSLAYEPRNLHTLERLVALLPQLGRRADAERHALQLIELRRE